MEEKKCCCHSEAVTETVEAVSAEFHECCRIRERSEKEFKALINRLNRVEGQIRGIRAMVEEDRYCIDILTQVAAAKSALDGFSQVLLDQHIRSCVTEQIRAGETEVVDELCTTIRKMMK